MSRIRVLIADDHAVVREGLVMFLADAEGVEVVGQASDGPEALELVERLKPDVLLLDLIMPKLDGLGVTRRLKAGASSCRVLILTSFAGEGQVVDAIRAGATGYLLKDVLKEDLLNAIRSTAEGKPWLHPEAQQSLMQQVASPRESSLLDTLTEREMDILRQIGQGKSNKEIAVALFLTPGTVKGYVSIVLGKLGLADRTQAALFAARNGLCGDEETV